MARILTIDPERTRGLRKLLFWVNKRQYGGVVPGILRFYSPILMLPCPVAGSTTTYTCVSPRRLRQPKPGAAVRRSVVAFQAYN